LNPVEWFRLGRLFVISLLLPEDSPSRIEQFITYPGVQKIPTSSMYGYPASDAMIRNKDNTSTIVGR
jgi:hypothetical protein